MSRQQITRGKIALHIQRTRGIDAIAAHELVSDVIDYITDQIASLHPVEIRGLGVFRFKRKERSVVRSVKDGEPIEIPAHLKLVFKPSRPLRMHVIRAGMASRTDGKS